MNIHVSHGRDYAPNPGDRIHFNFQTSKVRLAHDGSHLLIRFLNGSSSRIQDFYETDDLTVVSEGKEFSPDSLSEVMEIPDGKRIHNYDVMDAQPGLDRLDGLDSSVQHREHEELGQIRRDGETPRVRTRAAAVIQKSAPVEPEPDYFVNITPDGNGAELVIDEADLDKGLVEKSGSITIEAPAGISLITVAGKPVWKDGELDDLSDRTFETDEGRLLITRFEDGKLSYAFILDKNSLEHTKQGRDSVAHSFEITVTDRGGISESISVPARIVDDIPTAEPDEASLAENPESYTEPGVFAKVSGSIMDNDAPGQDGWGDIRFSLVSVPKGKYGTLTLNPDGTYIYT